MNSGTAPENDWTIRLDYELIDHLAIPESVKKLVDLKFLEDYLDRDEVTARNLFAYQIDHLRKFGKPATVDELHFVGFEDIDFTVPETGIEWLVEQFRLRYLKAKGEAAILKAANTFYADPVGVIQSVTDTLTQLRNSVTHIQTYSSSADTRAFLENYFATKEELGEGVSFGYQELDEHIGGMYKGKVYAMIARPKRYKSWQIIKSIAYSHAAQGRRIAVFTPEMPTDEFHLRYIANLAQVSWLDIEKGRSSKKDKERLFQVADLIEGDDAVKFFRPPIGQRKLTDLKSIAKDHGAELLVIDGIKYVEARRSYGDKKHLSIEEICEEMKADTCDSFPIYFAAQFSRLADSLQEMADLSKIGLSDAIGQCADVLMGIYMSKEMRQSHSFELGVMDARSVPGITWEMTELLTTHSDFRVSGVKGAD